MRAWIGVAVLCVACSANPNAPSVPAVPTITTLILSGQSNAVQLRPHLEDAYRAIGRVDGYAYGGLPIAHWFVDVSSYDFEPWPHLAPTLHQPARAFIWWQGESDATDPTRSDPTRYADTLSALFARIRSESGDLALFVLVCQIRDNHVEDTSAIREQIQRAVSRDPRARLVPVDDLPFVDTFHLTPAGYDAMARRLISLLP